MPEPTWLPARDATNARTVGQKMKTVRMTSVGVANRMLACRPCVRTVPPPLPVILRVLFRDAVAATPSS